MNTRVICAGMIASCVYFIVCMLWDGMIECNGGVFCSIGHGVDPPVGLA
jgi:hypothetical protein